MAIEENVEAINSNDEDLIIFSSADGYWNAIVTFARRAEPQTKLLISQTSFRALSRCVWIETRYRAMELRGGFAGAKQPNGMSEVNSSSIRTFSNWKIPNLAIQQILLTSVTMLARC